MSPTDSVIIFSIINCCFYRCSRFGFSVVCRDYFGVKRVLFCPCPCSEQENSPKVHVILMSPLYEKSGELSTTPDKKTTQLRGVQALMRGGITGRTDSFSYDLNIWVCFAVVFGGCFFFCLFLLFGWFGGGLFVLGAEGGERTDWNFRRALSLSFRSFIVRSLRLPQSRSLGPYKWPTVCF